MVQLLLYHTLREYETGGIDMKRSCSVSRLWEKWVENIALNSGAMRLPLKEDLFEKRRKLNLFDLKEYDFNETFEIFNISDYRLKRHRTAGLTG